MLIFLIGLLVFCVGIHRCNAQDLEQAALLPFADDPDAARNMTKATGRRCEHVVTPIFEAPDAPARYHLDA
ncbi:MAG: hypothetical protein ACOH2I_04570 [Pseudomonas sp.]